MAEYTAQPCKLMLLFSKSLCSFLTGLGCPNCIECFTSQGLQSIYHLQNLTIEVNGGVFPKGVEPGLRQRVESWGHSQSLSHKPEASDSGNMKEAGWTRVQVPGVTWNLLVPQPGFL